MCMNYSLQYRSGFSLIEIIVSLGLFAVIVTMSVGSLLALLGANSQTRDDQAVLTNLSFILDSMTREIRTGTYYYCDNGDFALQNSLGTTTQDCLPTAVALTGISFVEGGNSLTVGSGGNRIAFYQDGNDIMRRVAQQDEESMLADGITLNHFRVIVSGSRALEEKAGPGDTSALTSPVVTIQIEAEEQGGEGRVFNLQTTITQRTIDL